MSTSGKSRKSLLTRLISLEGAMTGFGLYSLGTGLWQGEALPIFWGVTILAGLAVLVAVRRRDWQQHWQMLEKPLPSDQPRNPEPPRT